MWTPKYRWKSNFLDDYARKWKIDREYGERAYGDKVKIEASEWKEPAEPDYEMHIKPYKPEKPAQAPEWWSEPPEPKQQPEPKQVEEVLNQSEPTSLDDLELDLKPEDMLEPVEKRQVDSEPKKTEAEPREQD